MRPADEQPSEVTQYHAILALRQALVSDKIVPELRHYNSYTDDDLWKAALLLAQVHYPLEALDWMEVAIQGLSGVYCCLSLCERQFYARAYS